MYQHPTGKITEKYHGITQMPDHTYTILVDAHVKVRVRSDNAFAPAVYAQRAIEGHLKSFKLDDLIVVSANCSRSWPHGCDNKPLEEFE